MKTIIKVRLQWETTNFSPLQKKYFFNKRWNKLPQKKGGTRWHVMATPNCSICFYDRNNLSWVFFFKGRCFKIFLSNICLTSLIYHCNLWWHRIPENKQRIEKKQKQFSISDRHLLAKKQIKIKNHVAVGANRQEITYITFEDQEGRLSNLLLFRFIINVIEKYPQWYLQPQ